MFIGNYRSMKYASYKTACADDFNIIILLNYTPLHFLSKMDKISPKEIKKIKQLCDKKLPDREIFKIMNRNGRSFSKTQISYHTSYLRKGFKSGPEYREWLGHRIHYLDALSEGDELREVGYDFERLRYVKGSLIIDIKNELVGDERSNIEKKALESDFEESIEEHLAHIKKEGIFEEDVPNKNDFILDYSKNSLTIKPKNKKSIEAMAFLSSYKKIWSEKT